MNFKKIIYNLDTLDKIEEGDKLIIREDILIINLNSHNRYLYRYLNSQGREKTHIFLIKLFDFFFLEIDKYNNYKRGISKLNINEINIIDEREYNNLIDKKNNAKIGLNKLKSTYKKDKYFTRKLDLLLQKI